MTVATRTGAPHPYYVSHTYASITVTGADETVVYHRSYAGATNNWQTAKLSPSLKT